MTAAQSAETLLEFEDDEATEVTKAFEKLDAASTDVRNSIAGAVASTRRLSKTAQRNTQETKRKLRAALTPVPPSPARAPAPSD